MIDGPKQIVEEAKLTANQAAWEPVFYDRSFIGAGSE